MGGYGDAVDAVDVVDQIFDFGSKLGGEAVAGSVGDVDDGGTGAYYGLDHPCEIFVVGAAGVFGIELDVFYKAFGVSHGFDGTLEDLFACGVEFIAYVGVGSTDTGVYARMFGISEGIGGDTYVVFDSAGEGADGRPGDGF